MDKSRLYPVLLGLALTAGVLWLHMTGLPLVESAMHRLDLLAYDLRLEATLAPKEPDERIVIIDIDERSLASEGRWPWPRDKVGRLVERLFNNGAAVVGFDILFAEAQANPLRTLRKRLQTEEAAAPDTLQALERLAPRFDRDAFLAERLAYGDSVLAYAFFSTEKPPTGVLPPPLPLGDAKLPENLSVPAMQGYTGNIPMLQEAARHGGFMTLFPDEDGIVRRAPVVARYDGKVYPSLALEMARLFFLVEKARLEVAPVGGAQALERVVAGPVKVPTDAEGRAIIPFRGPKGSYPYISATDVLQGNVKPEQLMNRIVLIGTTAQGLFDLRATPVQPVYPGVEVHANLLTAMLDGGFPVAPSWAEGADFVSIVATGLLLALLLPLLRPIPLAAVATLAAGAHVAFNFWLWADRDLVLSLAPQLLLVLLLVLANLTYGFLFEARGRRQLKSMFGQYVPPEIVEEMSRDPEAYSFEGETREMTVLFADIRNFTTISESLDAARLKEMLNRYFTPMTRTIFEHRGTVDKYVGDMIMAFWGAPLDDPDHAAHAVDAALGMLEESDALRPGFQRDGFPDVNIGIGINTGEMDVGDMGSEYRRAYTVLGDAVNLASRLEGTTKYYGARVVVGEETWRQTRERFLYRELDLVRVKGKERAIRVFEPLGRYESSSRSLRETVERHGRGLEAYRAQDWAAAEEVFSALHETHPDEPIYRLYLDRVAELKAAPPGPDWDGVYERTTK